MRRRQLPEVQQEEHLMQKECHTWRCWGRRNLAEFREEKRRTSGVSDTLKSKPPLLLRHAEPLSWPCFRLLYPSAQLQIPRSLSQLQWRAPHLQPQPFHSSSTASGLSLWLATLGLSHQPGLLNPLSSPWVSLETRFTWLSSWKALRQKSVGTGKISKMRGTATTDLGASWN